MPREQARLAGGLPGWPRDLTGIEAHGVFDSYLEDLDDRRLDPAYVDRHRAR
jgi:hypothetical protein